MTNDEMAMVMSILKTAYPRFYQDMQKREAEEVVNLWAEMFSAESLTDVAAAVKRYITVGKFPPTIADIRELLPQTGPTAADIWREAERLLGSGIGADNAPEAYARMSPACKAATLAVGGWYALAISDENDNRIVSAFLKAAERYICTNPQTDADLTGQALLTGGTVKLPEGTRHG